MPRRDGTGPSGKGQRTGRGLGFCANVDSKEPNANIGRGLGRGRRCGLGRGRGFGRCASINEENKE